MAEKKTTCKAAATKATEEKKPAAKKCATKKAAPVVIDSMTAGFKAGDVYEALAAVEKALTVKEIAKKAKITEEEAYVGMGWLFKEGKIVTSEGKYTLA